MKATVISVEPAKLKGKYPGFNFTYQGEPYKGKQKDPVTRFVFGNDRNNPALPNKVEALKPGQKVDLTFTENSQGYKNLSEITIEHSAPAQQTSGGYQKQEEEDETPVRIARSVALKAAVDSFQALTAAGNKTIKATMKPELFFDMVIDMSRRYEAYLCLQDEDEQMAGMVNSDEDFEQEDFINE